MYYKPITQTPEYRFERSLFDPKTKQAANQTVSIISSKNLVNDHNT